MNPITATQIKEIHVLKAAIPTLAEDDDAYRDFLEGMTGHRSSKDLTEAAAASVLETLRRLAGGEVVRSLRDPKTPVVSRLLREAYSAAWDVPDEPGPFDGSLEARRARCRERVVRWLKEHHPHIHGEPRRIEGWPLLALQDLLEHLKGLVKAKRSKKYRR